jgi:DNA-binding NarL/FixJ family response regulator
LLVIDRAIGSEQGLKYVYVVDQETKAQQRRVETGPLQDDGLRVITSGLKADDWAVTRARARQFTRELTARQREVIQLFAEGRPMKEIAGLIHLSEKTKSAAARM